MLGSIDSGSVRFGAHPAQPTGWAPAHQKPSLIKQDQQDKSFPEEHCLTLSSGLQTDKHRHTHTHTYTNMHRTHACTHREILKLYWKTSCFKSHKTENYFLRTMKVPLSFVSNQTPSTASLRADYAGGPFHQSNFLCSSQTLSKTVVTCVSLSSKVYAVLSLSLRFTTELNLRLTDLTTWEQREKISFQVKSQVILFSKICMEMKLLYMSVFMCIEIVQPQTILVFKMRSSIPENYEVC